MNTPAHQVRPPYRRIAADIAHRIAAGDLRPGDRIPSTRQISRDWEVAMATATKALATLNRDGLVHAIPGIGTIVRSQPRGRTGAHDARTDHRSTPLVRHQTRERVVDTAIGIADTHGLDALSMRQLAAELDVGVMSVYHYVTNKDDLVRQMVDAVFGRRPLPEPGPAGWRAKLELVSRYQWDLQRRHHWLAATISFTRPQLTPHAMAQTEWTLRALNGLGLSPRTMVREAKLLPAFVQGMGLSMVSEKESERQSGLTVDEWWRHQEAAVNELLASDQFPMLGSIAVEYDDLDALFEYGLARHLDGLAAIIDGGT